MKNHKVLLNKPLQILSLPSGHMKNVFGLKEIFITRLVPIRKEKVPTYISHLTMRLTIKIMSYVLEI